MNKAFSIFLIALLFASCQNSDNSESIETVTSDTTTTTTPAAAMVDPKVQGAVPNTVSAPPMTISPATTVTPAGAQPASNATMSSAVKEGLNPAHGAPGHRCDIAVGAPLNSPAGNNPAPAMTTAPVPAPVMKQAPVSAQPANPNAKLNPAHGQPGHDCAVPVGQPLKG